MLLTYIILLYFFFRKFFFQKNILIPNHLFNFIYQVYRRAESLNSNVHVGYHDIWPGSDSFIKEIFPKKNSIVHLLFYILNIYIYGRINAKRLVNSFDHDRSFLHPKGESMWVIVSVVTFCSMTNFSADFMLNHCRYVRTTDSRESTNNRVVKAVFIVLSSHAWCGHIQNYREVSKV